MLTLFACPKPFRGHLAVIQRNAIWSWSLLRPRPEIFLFGNEEGTAEVASELGVRHIPDVARNEFGTPVLDGMFGNARQLATFDLLCYVNADIILLSDFVTAVERVSRWRPHFLLVGRRWDVDIRDPLDFTRLEWSEGLKVLALGSGKQRPPEWIDYFVFSKDLATDLLPLAIGRTGWDNWLIWHARFLKVPIVDASAAVMAIHQNHDYSHHPEGERGVWRGEERDRNVAMIGGWLRYHNTADATHALSATRIEPNLYHWVVKFRRLVEPIYTPLWFAFLDFTRPVRHRLGLRRKANPESSGTPFARKVANSVGRLLAGAQFRGKWRLVNLLGRGLRRISSEADCFPHPHARIRVSLADRVGRLMWAGCYEPELVELLKSALRPGMVFVDVGANVGYFTVLGASLVGEKGQVYAFEPDPGCFSRLVRNTHHLSWVRTSPLAVSDTVGEIPFYASPRDDESGWGSILETGEDREELRVPVTSLDAFFDSQNQCRIDFVKMDVEGAEYRALCGGRSLLRRDRPLLYLESLAGLLLRDGRSREDLMSVLAELGYVADGIFDSRSGTLCSIWAVPKERLGSVCGATNIAFKRFETRRMEPARRNSRASAPG